LHEKNILFLNKHALLNHVFNFGKKKRKTLNGTYGKCGIIILENGKATSEQYFILLYVKKKLSLKTPTTKLCSKIYIQ
jgi:hypothetical protein